MQEDRDPRDRREKEDEDVDISKTRYDVDRKLDEEDTLEPELGVESEAREGHVERKSRRVDSPAIPADIESGVAPDEKYKLENWDSIDPDDGILDQEQEGVEIADRGADFESAPEPELGYDPEPSLGAEADEEEE